MSAQKAPLWVPFFWSDDTEQEKTVGRYSGGGTVAFLPE